MSVQPMILFGISNCDTVRNARKWLEQAAIPYLFQDVREQPLTQEQLQQWAEQVGWETLFNKRSTSFRALDEHSKTHLNECSALALIQTTPTLMKRPVLVSPSHILVGFSSQLYQTLLRA